MAQFIDKAGIQQIWEGVKKLIISTMSPKNVFLAAYSVGDIYITTNPTNPGLRFGGTWTAFAPGRALVGVNSADSDFNTVEKTGGAKTHTLTVAEMPSHSHSFSIYWGEWTENAAGKPAGNQITNRYNIAPQTDATGGGQPHNNLQPYITCYMWRRTA